MSKTKTAKTTATKKQSAKTTTTKRVAKKEVKATKSPAAIKELAQNLTKLFTPEPAKKARAAKPAKAAPAKPQTKTAILHALMSREGGATSTELQKAAGWQAHSVRGFITAVIRQKMGLNVVSVKNEAGERVYSIAA